MEENKKLPFLDLLMMSEEQRTINLTVFKKMSNTGLTIKPKSNQDPDMDWSAERRLILSSLNTLHTILFKKRI